MLPPSSPLAESLGKGLDPEDADTLVLRGEFDRLIGDAKPLPGDLTPDELIAKLEKETSKRWWLASLIIAVLAFLSLTAAFWRDGTLILAKENHVDGFREWEADRLADPESVYRPYEASEKLFLERARKGFERNPDSVAAYLLYSNMQRLMQRELPADFEGVSSRLEPDNGIWLLLSSANFLDQAIMHRTSLREPDPVLLAKAAESFAKAAESPRIDYHLEESGDLFRSGLHPETLLEALSLSPAQGEGDISVFCEPQAFSDPVGLACVQARKIADPQERSAFLRMSSRLMVRNLLAGGQVWEGSLETLSDLAASAGLSEERARFVRISRVATESKQRGAILREGQVEMASKSSWQKMFDSFWSNFAETWVEPLFDPKPINRVASLKCALLVSGAAWLVFGSVAWLRLIPFPRVPARVASCIAPLAIDAKAVCRAVLILLPAPFVAWLAGGIGVILDSSISSNALPVLTILAAVCSTISVAWVFHLVRKRLAKSLGAVGLRPSSKRILVGLLQCALVAIAGCLGMVALNTSDLALPAELVGGLAILIWLGSLLLGYLKLEDGIRQRIMARTLVSVFFIASLAMGTGAWAASQVEKSMVRKAWAAGPGPMPKMAAETRKALEGMLEEWK